MSNINTIKFIAAGTHFESLA